MATEKQGEDLEKAPRADGEGPPSGPEMELDQAMLEALMAAAAEEERPPESHEAEPPDHADAPLTEHDDDALIQPQVHKGDELLLEKAPLMDDKPEQLGPSGASELDADILKSLTADAELAAALGEDADEIIQPQAADAPPPEIPVAPAPDVDAAVPAPASAPAETVDPKPAAQPPVVAPKRLPVPLALKRLKPARNSATVAKVVASLSTGILAWFAVSGLLTLYHERLPDRDLLTELSTANFELCMSDARILDEMGQYAQAAMKVEAASKIAPSREQKLDALFEEVHVLTHLLSPDTPEHERNMLFDAANEFLKHAHDDPRRLEVIRCKAAVYENQGMTRAAYDTYRNALPNDGNVSEYDAVLLKIGELGVKVGRYDDAASYLLWLLDECPQSSLRHQARLMLADIYAITKRRADAQSLYEEVAKSSSELKVKALVGLAQLALEEDQAGQAVGLLQQAVSAADPGDKRGEAHYYLAVAQHADGQRAEARTTLEAFAQQFPKSELTADVLCELSQVLSDMGLATEAETVAHSAAKRFPNNERVLRTLAAHYIVADRKQEAADLLMQVVRMGTPDADLLLLAAQYRHEAGALDKARDAFEEIVTLFPHTPDSFFAQVEIAEILAEKGELPEAAKRLESLAQSAEDSQVLPILMSLDKLYDKMGLLDQQAKVSEQIAERASDSKILAEAALTLFDAGTPERALSVIDKIDLAKLDSGTAYNLLVRHSETLRENDPATSIGILKKAVETYPGEARPKDQVQLLAIYLANDDLPAAQRLFETMDKASPLTSQATVMLGDYHYEKKEFAAAIDMYDATTNAAGRGDKDAEWAAYQKANALAHTSDEIQALALYDEVAKSNTVWAKDARIKAENIRTRRLFKENTSNSADVSKGQK